MIRFFWTKSRANKEQVVIEKDSGKEAGEEDGFVPHKRRRIRRPTIDSQKAKELMTLVEAQEVEQQKLQTDVETKDYQISGLEIKLQKVENEKKTLHKKLSGLLDALGEVKEAVHTCKSE